jgi:NAD(P)-dependent dehydrogenase (short-subunit alcohol dehydrogenase family)
VSEASTGRLAGKVAVVTGGTRGIGRGIAEVFLEEGAAVAITGRNADQGRDAERELARLGPVSYVRHDVADEKSWADVLEHTTRRWGRLDTLVNNAGYSIERTLAKQTLDEFEALVATNLTGAFLGMKLGARAILATSGAGSIINLSSAAAAKAHAALGAYTAAKAGLEALTQCAALEHGAAGEPIRVNAIRPGHVRTAANEWFLARLGGGDVDAGARELGRQHPIGRIGEPRDVAYQALYLASDESAFVTGSVFACDGGFAL